MRAWSFLGALTFLVWAGTIPIRASLGSEARSVQAGVFTAEQAERGAKIYEEVCVACHQPEEFSEGAYMDGWAGQKMSDLIEHIRATMPQDNPGSLKRADYVDVGAFLLKINGVPAGDSEMDNDSAKEIVIEGPFHPSPDGQ
jgi:quinoprotein glucose dehydrogenase